METRRSGNAIRNPVFSGLQQGNTYPLAQSFVAVSGAADLLENTLATIEVPANVLGPNGALRIRISFTMTNNANAKTLRVRYSGAAGTQFINALATSVATAGLWLDIVNRGATNSQYGTVPAGAHHPIGTSSGAAITSAVDTTAATSVVVTAQKGTAGDTITLEGYVVEVIRP